MVALPGVTDAAYSENDFVRWTGSRLLYDRQADGSWVPRRRFSTQRNGFAAPDFPPSPELNQVHELLDGTEYQWDGANWNIRVVAAQGKHKGPWVQATAYQTGDSVTQNNLLYEANADIIAGTAFNIGTAGATWKLVGTPLYPLTVNATGSATTGVEFPSNVPGDELIVIAPPDGHQFQSTDVGRVILGGGLIVAGPVSAATTFNVVLETATASTGFAFDYVAAEPLAAEGADDDIRVAVSGDHIGKVWKKVAGAWVVQAHIPINFIGFVDFGETLPPPTNYPARTYAMVNTTDNVLSPTWELVKQDTVSGQVGWYTQPFGTQTIGGGSGGGETLQQTLVLGNTASTDINFDAGAGTTFVDEITGDRYRMSIRNGAIETDLV